MVIGDRSKERVWIPEYQAWVNKDKQQERCLINLIHHAFLKIFHLVRICSNTFGSLQSHPEFCVFNFPQYNKGLSRKMAIVHIYTMFFFVVNKLSVGSQIANMYFKMLMFEPIPYFIVLQVKCENQFFAK